MSYEYRIFVNTVGETNIYRKQRYTEATYLTEDIDATTPNIPVGDAEKLTEKTITEFVADGNQTTFPIPELIGTPRVTLDGMPTTGFTLSDAFSGPLGFLVNLTFSTTPPSGTEIEVTSSNPIDRKNGLVCWVGKERIEIFDIDFGTNTLLQCRRGTQGTDRLTHVEGDPDPDIGEKVWNASNNQNLTFIAQQPDAPFSEEDLMKTFPWPQSVIDFLSVV